MVAQPVPGPIRIKQLERYIAGCRRAERRIILGFRNANCAGLSLANYPVQRVMIEHVTACCKRGRREGFTSALMALRIARSKLQVERDGLPWECRSDV